MWKEAFELGIEDVDEQHKKLIELTDTIYDLVNQAEDGFDCYDEIVSIFKELGDYTVYHFNYEEQLMAKKSFLMLVEHKKEHDKFVKQIQSYSFDEIDYNQLESLHSVLDFLLEWISNHILLTDRKYVETLK